MKTDEVIRDFTSSQHALVTWHQLRSAGVSRSAVRHRLALAVLERLSPNVLRLTGVPSSYDQELMAAVLDAGPRAAASHEAAAALWELPGFPGPLDVSRPRGGAERGVPKLGELHEPLVLPPSQGTTVNGIPVTSVARTLFDLAGAPGLPEARLVRAVENAISRSPGLTAQLHVMLGELGARGRPGIQLMREVLDERPPGYVPPESGLEARVDDLLTDAGIAVIRQVDLGGEHWIGRVDFTVVGAPVVVEADSVIHHWSIADRERDDRRDRALAAIGLTTVRVTEDEAFHRPWLVAPRVAAAIQAAAHPNLPSQAAPRRRLPDPIRRS